MVKYSLFVLKMASSCIGLRVAESMIDLRLAKERVIGIKQSIKAVEDDRAKTVVIASDAQPHVVRHLMELCVQKNIKIEYIDTMVQLGKMCNIDVGAAAAAVLKGGE